MERDEEQYNGGFFFYWKRYQVTDPTKVGFTDDLLV